MGFMVILLLTLSALTSVELATAAQQKDKQLARQNALLGLQAAIGQLQSELGPDQRITAPATILSAPEELHSWVGVWDTTITDPALDSPKWLVSGELDPLSVSLPWDSQGRLTDDDYALLVGTGSVAIEDNNSTGYVADKNGNGKPDNLVAAPKVDININGQTTGAFAYWVSDESQKARVNLEQKDIGWTNMTTYAEGRMNLLALTDNSLDSISGFESLDFTNTDASEALERSLNYAELFSSLDSYIADTTVLKEHFHEFTAYSTGIPVNVKDGGLKQDLSLAFELEDDDFNASEFADDYTQDKGNKVSFLYKEETPEADGYIRGPTWSLLRNFYRLYKDVDSGNSTPKVKVQAMQPNRKALDHHWDYFTFLPYDNKTYWDVRRLDSYLNTHVGDGRAVADVSFPESMQIAPVVQRIMLLITVAQDNQGYLNVVYKPLVVLWNPYDATLAFDCIVIAINGIDVGIQIDFDFDDGATIIFDEILDVLDIAALTPSPARENNSYTRWYIKNGSSSSLSGPSTIGPGESKVFSVDGTAPTYYNGGSKAQIPRINLTEGWHSKGGIAGRVFPLGGQSSVSFNYVTPWSTVSMSDFSNDTDHRSYIKATISDTTPNFPLLVYNLIGSSDVSNAYNDVGDRSIFDFMYNYQPYFGLLSESERKSVFTEVPLSPSFPPPPDSGSGEWQEVPLALIDIFTRTVDANENVTNLGATHNIRAAVSNRKFANQMLDRGDEVFLDTRFDQPGSIDIEDISISEASNVYWGQSTSPDNGGQTHTPFFSIPTTPMLSLADFRHADIFPVITGPSMAIGNSRATPLLKRESIWDRTHKNQSLVGRFSLSDVSYLANEALFDGYFFSGIVPEVNYSTSSYTETRDAPTVLEDYFSANTSLSINPRITPNRTGPDASSIKEEFVSGSKLDSEAYKKSASLVSISGSFNVNTTNADAWETLLLSLRNQSLTQVERGGHLATLDDASTMEDVMITRLMTPMSEGDPFSNPWLGRVSLTDDQVRTLAEKIVEQVKLRGPFKSLADFVNRELIAESADTENLGLQGTLQAAIEEAEINKQMLTDLNSQPEDKEQERDYASRSHLYNESAAGIPGFVMQADLLQPLAPILTTRGDTFVIRAYGEAKNVLTEKPNAKAWCEAVVQRVPDFIDSDTTAGGSGQPAWTETDQLNTLNLKLGRQFRVISFRWLDPDQI